MNNLNDEIKDKELELQVLKEQKQRDELKVLKQLGDYSDSEKIVWFNKQYNDAYDTLMLKVDGKYEPDSDDEHYVWESWLELLGKNVWDIWNKY